MNSLAKAFGGAGYVVPQQQAIGGAAPDAASVVSEISRELERLGMGGDVDRALTALDSAKGLNESHVEQYNALPDQEKANFWRSLAGGTPQMPQGAPRPTGRMESPYGSGNPTAPVVSPWLDPEAPEGFMDSAPGPMGPGMLPNASPQNAGFQRPPMDARREYGPNVPNPYATDPDLGREPFDPNMMPGMGEDPRGMFWQEGRNSSFIPGAEYQTADLAGIDLRGKGGVGLDTTSGPANNAAQMAFAYRSFMNTVDDYEKAVKEHGGALMPGKERDAISNLHTALMMQLKDIYAMGAPQQGDLAMLERSIPNPNNFGMRAVEMLGGADAEDRTVSGLANLRKAVTNIVEPYAKAGGMDMNEIYQPKTNPAEMSDDDLRKALGL